MMGHAGSLPGNRRGASPAGAAHQRAHSWRLAVSCGAAETCGCVTRPCGGCCMRPPPGPVRRSTSTSLTSTPRRRTDHEGPVAGSNPEQGTSQTREPSSA